MTITNPQAERVRTLKVVLGWVSEELAALGVTPETEMLRNEVGWLSMTLMKVARILEQPVDQTMKDLPVHAEKVMQERKEL